MPIVDYATLKSVLHEYKNINNKIKYMKQKGFISSFKKRVIYL